MDGRLWVTCAVSPECDSEDDTALDVDDGRLLVVFSFLLSMNFFSLKLVIVEELFLPGFSLQVSVVAALMLTSI